MHEKQKPPARGEQLLTALLREQQKTNEYLRHIHIDLTVIVLILIAPLVLAMLFFFLGAIVL